jgi:hypothetical protein
MVGKRYWLAQSQLKKCMLVETSAMITSTITTASKQNEEINNIVLVTP